MNSSFYRYSPNDGPVAAVDGAGAARPHCGSNDPTLCVDLPDIQEAMNMTPIHTDRPVIPMWSLTPLAGTTSAGNPANTLGNLSLPELPPLPSLEIHSSSLDFRLGPYQIREVLGHGGMGMVLRGEDSSLRREVAIKVMRSDPSNDVRSRQRFLREAEAVARLDHENIIPIWYVGEEAGVLFMVMPLLRGETLEQRLTREGTLDWHDALCIIRDIAAGLVVAHDAHLIHRDIKPGNLFLEIRKANPGGFRVRVLDFGLALLKNAVHLTQSGMVVGTPSYMAPEQAAGHVVDGRADLFSLGSVLYQMLTGKLPFPGRDILSIFNALANTIPASPGKVKPGIPAEVSRLTMKLLEKLPAKRFARADLVVAEIDGLLERHARNMQKRPHTTFAGSPATFWGMIVLILMFLMLGIVVAFSL